MARKKSNKKNTRESSSTSKAGRKLARKSRAARASTAMPESSSTSQQATGPKQYRSGSEFVREQPPDKPTKQVVEEAEALGLKVTPNLVRIVRFKMRHGGEPRLAAGGRRVRSRAVSQGRAGRAGTGVAGALGVEESRFRTLILQLGTARARALLDEIESRIQTLL